MKIILVQSEIEDALRQYVTAQGIVTAGKSVDINLIAGRGPNGITAELDIAMAASNVPVAGPAAAVVEVTATHEDQAEAAVEEAIEETKDAEEDQPAPAVPGKSLFGS